MFDAVQTGAIKPAIMVLGKQTAPKASRLPAAFNNRNLGTCHVPGVSHS